MNQALDSVDEDCVIYPLYNKKARFGELKLEVGMISKTNHEFMNATKDYTIQWSRNIIFKKNDNMLFRVVCKGEDFPWKIYCALNKSDMSWQKLLNYQRILTQVQ
ncbi:hypothetical protein Ahy_A01g003045 [Arachis hypogaea]|uniref:Transposase MuDR plant domain-containing protein n=1 Tax=Arachis hypogaea TaxID=3818 RepID=A0A445ES39_ARAHY|nr:hypothetical protein Ahy_A01g003045 [Arachis hypogaea]